MQVVNKKMCVVIILMLVIIESCTLFLMYKSYNNKNTKLDEVELNINEKNRMFAIMLEQEDGTYKEDTSNTWPTSGYKYNASMSGCIDINGNKLDGVLTYDSTNNIATVDTGKTSYCYLYFDKDKSIPILELDLTDGETLTFDVLYVIQYTYNGDGEIKCYTDSELFECSVTSNTTIRLKSNTSNATTFTLTLEASEGEKYKDAKLSAIVNYTFDNFNGGGI